MSLIVTLLVNRLYMDPAYRLNIVLMGPGCSQLSNGVLLGFPVFQGTNTGRCACSFSASDHLHAVDI